jgi:hypothetical protein
VDVLKHLPDPRKRQGRRHRWLTLLCLIVAALASAQRTPRASARWVRDHREELVAVLPPSVSRLPSDATIQRTLALLDVTRLEQALSAFQPATAPPSEALRHPPDALQGVAIDAKAIRGVGRAGPPCHLVSLVQHDDARVLGQVEDAPKRDERSAVPALLVGRNLTGTVITLDALHTVRPTARQIRAQNGHSLMIVKKTKPRSTSIWTCSSACQHTQPIVRYARRSGRRPKRAWPAGKKHIDLWQRPYRGCGMAC